MNFLSRMTCGTYGMVRIAVDALRFETLPRAELISRCCPPSVVPDPMLFESTLDTWTELGLFRNDVETKTISLAMDVGSPLPTVLRRLLLHHYIELDLWVDDGVTDFLRASAWLMAQEPYQFLELSWSGINKLLAKQFATPTSILTNETWTTYRHWARILGLGWETWYPGNVNFMIDPTEAVRSELPGIFGNDIELSIDLFLSKLAEAIPVLDQGIARKAVESQRIDAEEPRSDAISPTLSFAMERLAQEGIIRLHDTGTVTRTMLGRRFAPWKTVASVISGGTDAAR